MTLEKLVQHITVKQIYGKLDINIEGIDSDSRNIKEKYLFIAVKGTTVDGHEFIDKAIEQGATAIVCENLPQKISDKVAYIQTNDSAEALGRLASTWYGEPSKELTLVGVTGTNGKTTTATLLYELFRLFGEKVGLLSTVCNYIDALAIPATHTTPDPLNLHKLLREW